ncbi:MAG: hypothetical protein MI723_03125, partial [Caulobacterales bacterium]|nr:hypothetical protein [Caulobacterales bacterium]
MEPLRIPQPLARLARATSLSDLGWTSAALAVAALAALPIAAVLAAFLSPGGEAWAHLVETNLAVYLANTLALMVMVGVLSGVIGVSVAWLIAAAEF